MSALATSSPLQLVPYGSAVLHHPAQPVQEVTDEIRALAVDMFRLMYESKGVGLAAPQAGVGLRLIVMDGRGVVASAAPLALVNPEIVSAEGAQVDREGCLSLPGAWAPVRRAMRVRVQALDLEQGSVTLDLARYEARIVQHEVDHLNGRLFISRIPWHQRWWQLQRSRWLVRRSRRGA